VIAAVLAAGESKRFGECKLVARILGRPMITHVVESLPSSIDEIVIITGAYRESVEAELAGYNVVFVHNNSFAKGMASSVVQAARYAIQKGDDLLLTLGDLPFVGENDYKRLIEAFRNEAVFSSFEGVVGAPAIFSSSDLQVLTLLKGDKGARSMYPNAQSVEICAAAKDVDLPEDIGGFDT
jgi:molybdenum cofactor cytidylyltransferase